MNSNRNALLAAIIAVLVIGGIVVYAMLNNNNQALESNQQNTNSAGLVNNADGNMNMNMDTNANANVPTNTITPSNNANNNSNTNTQPTVKTFNVTGQNFSFSPAKITVNKGDKVKIVFTSKGMTHDWVLDQFNAKTPILSDGQTSTIEFTADKSGTYEYYCSVGNHRQMGMVGSLVVN